MMWWLLVRREGRTMILGETTMIGKFIDKLYVFSLLPLSMSLD